ncbi:MAG: hypothetical protein EOP00_13845 [Pedobacter sp.]|nr:MAG: hypothetical protein EOP00_13845 [Pedobacter sp.]
MEPFNIKISHHNNEVTLTILPEKDYFKIIYFGGIVGAIKPVGHEWVLVEEEEIEPGDLPLYEYKHGYADERPKLELNLPEINRIAAEIENVIH